MVPLVFWLALISNATYNVGSVTIHPVPFAKFEDCVIAATHFEKQDVVPVCYQQPEDDVYVFQRWSSATVGYNR